MLIYCHTNKTTDKHYVGQTRLTMTSRWKGHCKSAKRPGKKSPFHCAIMSHGEDDWLHVVLEDDIMDENALNEREVFWIARLRANEPEFGYNCTSGGDKVIFTDEVKKTLGNRKGFQHTPESKRAISNSSKSTWDQKIADGYVQPADQVVKGAVARRGKKRAPMSEETREKIGAAHRGVKETLSISDETREKLKARVRDRMSNPEAREKFSGSRRFPDEKVQQALEEYKSGAPLDELADKYKIGDTTLMRRFRKLLEVHEPVGGWNWSSVRKRIPRPDRRKS